jgi:hypothetical protein
MVPQSLTIAKKKAGARREPGNEALVHDGFRFTLKMSATRKNLLEEKPTHGKKV